MEILISVLILAQFKILIYSYSYSGHPAALTGKNQMYSWKS